jgi:redox-sensitive bicupin YhaK (pirin superfamily)
MTTKISTTSTEEHITGEHISYGTGFEGLGFRYSQYQDSIDPLIMIDHYAMTEPTFGEHPHAGISAISVLFEDTVGKFHNRDTLGNNFDIEGGDIYWLNAGSGAVHDESPRAGAKIHGLQIFLNLPSKLKHQPPSSMHVRKTDMPILSGSGYNVRLALGRSNDTIGVESPVWPLTILDGYVSSKSKFKHKVPMNFNCWLYSVEKDINYKFNNNWLTLKQGDSVSFGNFVEIDIEIKGQDLNRSHFIILSGKKVEESFVQHGPFVMNSQEEIINVIDRFNKGELGSL